MHKVHDMRPRCCNPRCGARKSKQAVARGKVLAEKLTRPWVLKCPRCGFVNKKE